MTLLVLLVSAHAALVSLVYLAAWVAAVAHLRRGPVSGTVAPMTVIRPLKGLDEGLEENLRSLLEADTEGVLEILFAIESEDDPAHPVARRIAASEPGRAKVVLTGANPNRMGKIHNMIEALRHATKDRIVFSDSDARIDREVLVETSRAFAAGADAVSGLPDASLARAPGDVLVCLCFNHYFDPIATLLSRCGAGSLFSGTWMGVRRDVLDRLGGLERFALHAADDFALADALRRAGARVALLPRLVALHERGGDLSEALRHIVKWTRIVRWTVPWGYALLPLATTLPLALAALLSAPADLRPAGLWLSIAFLRSAGAWALDQRTAASRFPSWAYAALPLIDLSFVGLWVAGWLGDTIEWRGRRYRLRPGGLLESL